MPIIYEQVDKLISIYETYTRKARFESDINCISSIITGSNKSSLTAKWNTLPERFYHVATDLYA